MQGGQLTCPRPALSPCPHWQVETEGQIVRSKLEETCVCVNWCVFSKQQIHCFQAAQPGPGALAVGTKQLIKEC